MTRNELIELAERLRALASHWVGPTRMHLNRVAALLESAAHSMADTDTPADAIRRAASDEV